MASMNREELSGEQLVNYDRVEKTKQYNDINGSHDMACEEVGCCKGCFKTGRYEYCTECYESIMNAMNEKFPTEMKIQGEHD